MSEQNELDVLEAGLAAGKSRDELVAETGLGRNAVIIAQYMWQDGTWADWRAGRLSMAEAGELHYNRHNPR